LSPVWWAGSTTSQSIGFVTSKPRPLLSSCDQKEVEKSLVDECGMTPFHVCFSTIGPASSKLLKVLLDNKYPYNALLGWKDANGKRAMDYLVTNWNETTASLLQMTLQKWMLDRLDRWGATSWMEAMQSKVQDILGEGDKERRSTLFNEACSAFAQYETMAAPFILEMALWNLKLKSGWSNGDGQALDRGECRYVCGSGFVIPKVLQFLGIARPDTIEFD